MVAEIVFKGLAVLCWMQAAGLTVLALSPCFGNRKLVRSCLCSAGITLAAGICCAIAGSLA